MNKLRLAVIAAATVATAFSTADAGRAVATVQTVNERVVTASGQLEGNSQPFVTITASLVDGATGGIAAPAVTTSSSACLTFDPPGTEQATQTHCGPATIEVSPTLDTATVSGVIEGVRFTLKVLADGSPQVSADPPQLISSAITVSRVGTAMATMVGGVLGEAETQGSSWYAEVREKVKTSATPQ